ncbi:MAG: YeeE/YedE family protein [Chitinophagales bacterium]
MKFLKFLLVGTLFGIVMTKSEAISWYRIQEMFRFQAFHMYGIIGTALVLGASGVALIKKFRLKSIAGEDITFKDKNKGFVRYFVGGTIFGLGWALAGACPGPIYTLIGNGYTTFIVLLLSGILGTFTYGALRSKLPH